MTITGKRENMLKPVHEFPPPGITRKELVGAARAFLIQSNPTGELVPSQSITSLEYGSCDLLFVNRTNANLTAAKIRHAGDQERVEKFVVSSLCYYFWLLESITIGEVVLRVKTQLDLYLFAPDFSSAIFYLVDNLIKDFPIHVVKYNRCDRDDVDAPTVHFQDVTFKGMGRRDPQRREPEGRKAVGAEREEAVSPEISPQELSEFYRLGERYLD
jgi:hypothetical protein